MADNVDQQQPEQQESVENRMLGRDPQTWLHTEATGSADYTTEMVDEMFSVPSPCLPDDFGFELDADLFTTEDLGMETSEGATTNSISQSGIQDVVTDMNSVELSGERSEEQRDSYKMTIDVLGQIIQDPQSCTTELMTNVMAEREETYNHNVLPPAAGDHFEYGSSDMPDVVVIDQAVTQVATPHAQNEGHPAQAEQVLAQATQGGGGSSRDAQVSSSQRSAFCGDHSRGPSTPRDAGRMISSQHGQSEVTPATSATNVSQEPRKRKSSKTNARSTRKEDERSATKRDVSNPHQPKQHAPTNAELPTYHDLQIKVYYRTLSVVDTTVNSPHGCLVYFNQHDQPWGREELTGLHQIKLPVLNGDHDSTRHVTESQMMYTNRVLDVVEKGVRIWSDPNNGNIYATRRCRAKVFWWSSVEYETTDTAQEMNRDEEHDTPVLIFNYEGFKRQLKEYVIDRNGRGVIPCPRQPEIVLTFAQRWNRHDQLDTRLVYAIIEPLRAKISLEWIAPTTMPKRVNPELHTSLFQISHASQP